MEKELTKKLFGKARMDIYRLDVFAQDLLQADSVSRLQAGTLHQMASQAACSTLALKCAMDGVGRSNSGEEETK